jgi:hypothetical protein
MASGVKDAYQAKLKSHKIETFGQLAALTDETMRYIAQHPDRKKRIPSSKLKGVVFQEEKPTPLVLNHTKKPIHTSPSLEKENGKSG